MPPGRVIAEIPVSGTTKPPHVAWGCDGRDAGRLTLDDWTKPGISLSVCPERDRQRDVRREDFGRAGKRRISIAPSSGPAPGGRVDRKSADQQPATRAAIMDLSCVHGGRDHQARG